MVTSTNQSDSSFVIVESLRGSTVEPSALALFVERLATVTGQHETYFSRTIYRIVLELTANVCQHAYCSETDNFTHRDWILDTIVTKDNSLQIKVTDGGISIPQSILTKCTSQEVYATEKGGVIEQSDGLLIENAVFNTSSSAYKIKGRGQGLSSIARLTESGNVRSLSIRSRFGAFYYGKDVRETKTLLHPVEGTAIDVTLPIQEGPQ